MGAATGSASGAATVDPPARGRPPTGDGRALRRVARVLFTALGVRRRAVLVLGRSRDSRRADRPPPTRKIHVFISVIATSLSCSQHKGLGMSVPPLLPYEALREQLDLYREKFAEHGNEPDIVWIRACSSTRTATPTSARPSRESEASSPGMHRPWSSTRARDGPADHPPATACTAGSWRSWSRRRRRDNHRRPGLGWHPGGHDRADRGGARGLEGLKEISITVNPGSSTTGRRSRTRSSSPHRVMPHFRSGRGEA